MSPLCDVIQRDVTHLKQLNEQDDIPSNTLSPQIPLSHIMNIIGPRVRGTSAYLHTDYCSLLAVSNFPHVITAEKPPSERSIFISSSHRHVLVHTAPLPPCLPPQEDEVELVVKRAERLCGRNGNANSESGMKLVHGTSWRMVIVHYSTWSCLLRRGMIQYLFNYGSLLGERSRLSAHSVLHMGRSYLGGAPLLSVVFKSNMCS